MKSAKDFSQQTENQFLTEQELSVVNHPASCHVSVQQNNIQSSFPMPHLHTDNYKLPNHNLPFQPSPSFGSLPPFSAPRHSQVVTISSEDTDSQYNFPHYQLADRNRIETPQDNQEDFLSYSLPQTLDGNMEDQQSVNNYLNEQNSRLGLGNSIVPSERSRFKSEKIESLPIDIQSSGSHQTQLLYAPPASDLRGGSCSNFGSASSTPGGQQLYHQPESFHATGSNPRFSYENSNFPMEQKCSFSSVHSDGIIQPSEDSPLPVRMQLDNNFSSNKHLPLQDVDILDDLVFDEGPNSQSCPDYVLPSNELRQQVTENSVNFFNNQHICGQLPYPPRTHSNSISESSSFTYIPLSPYPPSEFRLEQDSNNHRALSEKQKADQRRIKNNRACKKARQKRKQHQLDTEARVAQLTLENTHLKEKVRELENNVGRFRAGLPCPATTDLTYFQQ